MRGELRGMGDGDPGGELRYCVDARDVIVAVGGAWLDFAKANDGQNLEPRAVIGQSLWNYVRSRALRTLYGQLLDHVRRRQTPFHFAFRCDSPGVKRSMAMALIPLDDYGSVEFVSRIIAVEPRVRPVTVREGFRAPRSVVYCNLCSQLRVDGQWLPLEEAIARHPLLADDRQLLVIHGACDACRGALQRRLKGSALG
ncbi:MAG: hypothetical protein ACFCBW_01395 [Candidatus Competibacterales bacterium]